MLKIRLGIPLRNVPSGPAGASAKSNARPGYSKDVAVRERTHDWRCVEYPALILKEILSFTAIA